MRLHSISRARTVSRGWESLEDRIVLSAAPPAVSAIAFASTSWGTDFTDHLLASGLGQDHKLVDGHEVLSAGYLAPTGSTAQEEALPWDNIDEVRITFSEDVAVDAADLSLTSTSQPYHAFADFQYYPEVRTAVWTLSQALDADRYWIDLDAGGSDAVADLGGAALDGEWTNSVSIGDSGDGTAGGDFEFAFNVLPGDVLGLGVLEWNGLYTIYYREGYDTTNVNYLPKADVDGDGLIEASDWQAVYNHLFEALPTGSPIGSTDDAPTTAGFAPTQIDAADADVVFSLYGLFDDAEDSDPQLTYAVESIGDPSLFDTVSIDQQTGELTVNVSDSLSGRSVITVSATDSSGQRVQADLQVDANRQNLTPDLTVTVSDNGLGLWFIEGWVTDPDLGADVGDFYVVFTGDLSQRVSVADDGYYYFAVLVPPGQVDAAWASVSDGIQVSSPVYFEVG